MILIELLDCHPKVGALLPLDEQLCDLGATLHVLGPDLAHLALLARVRARLGLDVRRAEGVVGELAFVFGLGDLGLAVPDLALLVRHVLPGEPDDLGERAVVRLNLGRDVPALDERGAEEDERVRRAGDVVVCFLLPVSGLLRACAALGIRGEERGRGLCALDGRGFLGERDRRDRRGESDLLRCND